jgi:hypothetical protein
MRAGFSRHAEQRGGRVGQPWGAAVSLDFILVKPKVMAISLSDLEPDESFGKADFRAAAEALFGVVDWQADGSGIVRGEDVSVELRASESSLHVSVRGRGDIVGLMRRVASDGLPRGLVVIDVQVSEILEPGEGEDPDYVNWYRSVIQSGGR